MKDLIVPKEAGQELTIRYVTQGSPVHIRNEPGHLRFVLSQNGTLAFHKLLHGNRASEIPQQVHAAQCAVVDPMPDDLSTTA